MAERAAAEARRASSHHLPKPAPQAHGPLQGPPATPPPPYRPPMTAHMQRMPHYRRRRESPPNPEAETVRAHPRVHIRVHPHSPRTPTEQDYEESPRPATAAGPHDPITPTHAHSSAQDRRPAQEQWWQRWTHTQLWELRKWARGEPSLEGLVHRPRKGSVENCRLRPAGGWMPQAAWEAMLADALHPLGVHPRNLPAPQDHPYVLRRLRETLREARRDGIRLWDITQSPAPHAHTPSPPHKRRRTDTGDTHNTPGALRATQHDAPDPPGQRRRHLTPLSSTAPPRGATPGPAQKSPNKPDAEGSQRTRQRAPLRPKAPNPGPIPWAPLHPQHDTHVTDVTPPPCPLPRHRPAPPPLPPHVPTPPSTQPHTLRHSIALVRLLHHRGTWHLTVDRRPVVPLPPAPLPGPHPTHAVFAPTSRAADILPLPATTPPGHRILLAANPSVLSEVPIGHADALHVRPLLPNLHAAYAPGTPVDPSVWDSQ